MVPIVNGRVAHHTRTNVPCIGVYLARPACAILSPVSGPPVRSGAFGLKGGLTGDLLRGAAGSFALSLVNTGMTFLATALLARALGVSGFGVFAFVVALGLLLAVPAVLGFDRLSIRDVAVYLARSSWRPMRGLVIVANLLVLANSSLLAVLVGLVVSFTTSDPTLRNGLLVGLLAIPAMAIGRIDQGVLMGLHRVVGSQVPDLALRPTLFLFLVLGTLWLSPASLDPSFAIGLHVMSIVAATGATLILLRRSWPRAASGVAPTYETRTWVRGGLSLTLLSGVMIVNAQSGIVMLGLLSGPDQAGLFSVAARGAALIAFGLGAVNAALQPAVSRLWTTGRMDELQALVTVSARAVLLFAVPVTGIFVLFAADILSLTFGSDYVHAAPALAILAAAQLLNAAIGSVGTLLIMTGHQRDAAFGIAVGAALNIMLNLVLIPVSGAVGAAIAAAISIAVWNTLLALAALRRLGIHSTALGRLPARLGHG